MKKLLSLLWYAVMMTLLYMALGGPAIFLAWILLMIADVDSLIVPFMILCAAVLFAYHLYTGIKEKVV